VSGVENGGKDSIVQIAGGGYSKWGASFLRGTYLGTKGQVPHSSLEMASM